MLGSRYSQKVSFLLRKLTKNTLLDAYRLFHGRLCVGRRNKLEKAGHHAPYRSSGINTRAGADLEKFRDLSHNLKLESAKKSKFVEGGNSCASPVCYQSPQIIEYRNVYYHPDYRCLFTEEGYRIKSSYALSWIETTPDKIEPPEKCKVIDKPFLYIGAFETYQYGHFLIEGISHLWALAENNDMPVFYANWMNSIRKVRLRRRKSYIDMFMGYMPISRDDLYYSDQWIKFNKICIPEPTSVFGRKMLNHHRLVPEYIARQVLKTYESKFPEYETIYLSRSKLKDGARGIIHESDLEKRLSDKGVQIVHPESMSLVEQIMLLNSCKNIIAVQGSALHNILFVLGDNVNVYTICSKNTWLGSFYMVDKVKEAQLTNTYIWTLSSVSSNEPAEWKQDKIIDVEETMSELSKNGLFD